jgi:hypothetical protein
VLGKTNVKIAYGPGSKMVYSLRSVKSQKLQKIKLKTHIEGAIIRF